MFVGWVLLEQTDPSGLVMLTIAQVCRDSGFKKTAVGVHMRALKAAGLLIQDDPGLPFVLRWNHPRIAELAEKVGESDAQWEAAQSREAQPARFLHAPRERRATLEPPRELSDWQTWEGAFRKAKPLSKRYRMAEEEAELGPIALEGRALILAFGEKHAAKYPILSLAELAFAAAAVFYENDAPRLLQEGHPFCFFPREIERLFPRIAARWRSMMEPVAAAPVTMPPPSTTAANCNPAHEGSAEVLRRLTGGAS